MFTQLPRVLNYGNPVNKTAPLNRGLRYWYLNLPQKSSRASISDRSLVTLSGDARKAGSLSRPAGFGSLYLDGTGDIVTIPSLANVVGDATKLAFALWEYPLVAGNTRSVNAYQGGTACLSMNHNATTNRLSVDVRTSGYSGTLIESSNDAFTVGKWNHVVVVINADSDQHYIFSNGVQVASSTTACGAFENTTDTTFSIAGYGNYYNGYFDDLRVYIGESAATVSPSSFASRLYQASRTGYQRELNWLDRPWLVDSVAGGATAVPVFYTHMQTQGMA